MRPSGFRKVVTKRWATRQDLFVEQPDASALAILRHRRFRIVEFQNVCIRYQPNRLPVAISGVGAHDRGEIQMEPGHASRISVLSRLPVPVYLPKLSAAELEGRAAPRVHCP